MNNLRTERGAKLFLALTEADPASALECLKRTVGKWSIEELKNFKTGRRQVVWALERIVIWRELFADGARLLLRLAEAENETWSNNATGEFISLFIPAPGKVSATEAPPEERFVVLKEAIESESKAQRLLGIRAADAALTTNHFSRVSGAEFQGLKKEPVLWAPKTYGEWWSAYKRVWEYLMTRLEVFELDERDKVIDILLRHIRGLVKKGNLSEMVIASVDALKKKPYVDKQKLLAEIIEVLHYNSKDLKDEVKDRLEQLKDELTGNDFTALLRRYVGMDLLEDKFDENGKMVDKTSTHVVELSKEACANPELLKGELAWLVSGDAQNAYKFAYELGKHDDSFSLLPDFLEAQRNAVRPENCFFLGGYFKALFESNQDRWEEELEAIAKDEQLNICVAELTWRSGMTDRAAKRILDLAQQSKITIEQLSVFRLGSVINVISEEVFRLWQNYLMESEKIEGVLLAMSLFSFYYRQHKELPESETFALLTHPLLGNIFSDRHDSGMNDFNWAQIANKFLKQYPSKGLQLAEFIVQSMGKEGSMFNYYDSNISSVLTNIVKQNPESAWSLLGHYLSKDGQSSYNLIEWLGEKKLFEGEAEASLIFLIPQDTIWNWVDEEPKLRAPIIAELVPQSALYNKESYPLLKELLKKYGQIEEVGNSLVVNFSTEGWSGPASLHYKKKRDALLAFMKDENDVHIKEWAARYLRNVEHDIKTSEIEEERRGY